MLLKFINENLCRLNQTGKVEFAAEAKGSILIKGYALTYNRIFPRTGDPKFIFTKSSISQQVIDEYLKKPIIQKIHNDYEFAIGETLTLENRDDGLYIEAVIRPAGQNGRDAVEQIKANPIRSLSIGFMMEMPEYDETLGAYKPVISELFEISIVNLGRDEEAVFEIAQQFNQIAPGLASGDKTRRHFDMEPKPVTQEEFNEVKSDLDGMKVTLGQIDPKAIEKIARLEKIVGEYQSQDNKTRAEFSETLDRIVKDHTKAMDDLKEAYNKAWEKNIGDGERSDLPITAQQALLTDAAILQRMFTKERFDQICEFRNMSDLAFFSYQFLNPQNQLSGGEKEMIVNKERFLKMKQAKNLSHSAHRFAMDTATDAEGADFIPVGYSTELIRKVRLASRVDGLFDYFRMQEANAYVNMEGDDILPLRHTQTTTVQTARADSNEQTPGTDQAQFTAEKLRTRIQISGEMTEDSMVEVFDYVFNKTAIGFARGIDKWWISGDNAAGTGLDSGDAPGSTDVRYCGNGLRVWAYGDSTNSPTFDMGTFDYSNAIKLISKLDKYAVDPTRCALITSAKSYFLNWMGKIGKDYMATLEKAGPAAIIFSGQVNQFAGIPIILSEWILSTFDSTGAYSGSGNTQTIELICNRDAFRRGIWRPMATEVVRNAHFDIWDVITWHRTDIQKVVPSTDPVVGYGFNVPTI